MKTMVYILISVVTILSGALVTAYAGSSTVRISVGTSLLAAGIASLIAAVVRALDDRDTTRNGNDILAQIAQVRGAIRERTVGESNPGERCVTDRTIGDEFRTIFQREVDLGARDEPVKVDATGLKLFRFLDDQVPWLKSQKREIHVRLLLQNPDEEVFSDICRLENRSLAATVRDIESTLNMLKGGEVSDNSYLVTIDSVTFELRYYSDYQPVTLFCVGRSSCVRPRVSTPKGQASRFYETYYSSSGREQSDVYLSHFEKCWNESKYRTPKALKDLSGVSDEGGGE